MHVEPRKIVVLQLGNGEAVTDEHQRRLGPWRRVKAHTDDGVLAERERPGLAAAHQLEGRILLHDAARTKLDRLHIAVLTRGQHARFLELAGDILGRLAMAFGAGEPFRMAIAAQGSDVGPPALAMVGGAQCGR